MLWILHCSEHDADQVPALVSQIRRISSCPLIVIGDGVEPPPCDAISLGEPRRKGLEFGGEWNWRWINILVQTGEPWGVKIDPDSWVYRMPSRPPAGYAGAYHQGVKGHFLIGGACALTREGAIAVLPYLRDRQYTQPQYGYQRYARYRKEGEPLSVQMVAHCDLILMDACQRAGVPVSEWSEVKATHREYVGEGEWAIAHPVKREETTLERR